MIMLALALMMRPPFGADIPKLVPAQAEVRVKDDPFKAYSAASIVYSVPPVDGLRHYCFTGGEYTLWAHAPRDGAPAYFGFSIFIKTLRSPGNILDVEMLGGRRLEGEPPDASDFYCYRASCHNDAFASYIFSAAAVAELRANASTPFRVTTSSGEECNLTIGVLRGDIERLSAWAATAPRK